LQVFPLWGYALAGADLLHHLPLREGGGSSGGFQPLARHEGSARAGGSLLRKGLSRHHPGARGPLRHRLRLQGRGGHHRAIPRGGIAIGEPFPPLGPVSLYPRHLDGHHRGKGDRNPCVIPHLVMG